MVAPFDSAEGVDIITAHIAAPRALTPGPRPKEDSSLSDSDCNTLAKICTKCDRSLPATTEYFQRRHDTVDGFRSCCIECHNADRRASYARRRGAIRARYAEMRKADPERYRAYALCSYHKLKTGNNRRRARLVGAEGSHTAQDIVAQLDRQKERCFYCGVVVGKTYHVDHVVPLALGGSNGPENLVISCPHCNSTKGARHPMEFCGLLF